MTVGTAQIGFVYALSNRGMPGLLKVGKTERTAAERAFELSACTGVPAPFEVVVEVSVPDIHRAERYLHRELSAVRFTKGREFFRTSTYEVSQLMARMTKFFELEAEGQVGQEISLHNESGIVWLDEPSEYPYVREGWRSCIGIPKRPRWNVGRIVGYATQGNWRMPGQKAFDQRVFFVKPYDRSEDPCSDYYRTENPTEAVYPLSISAGVRGQRLG
ncbi:DUF6009 family protein [Nocardia sp. CDC153]|uniref:DUF6009 family protein n=1 Tax=Nocardia sp. CDC153 TaxID=3112167 RepID=UPI002DB6232C|nr:DUF6009 family protein [Nocardia sp. CDC153]MEC3957519.1 DUF6009 family protein [Nocardia sp. CDC153]